MTRSTVEPTILSADRWDLQALTVGADLHAARTRRLLIALAAVWLLNLFDLGFTLLAGSLGVLVELNPLARWVMAFGSVALIAYKLVTVSTGSIMLWLVRNHRIAEIGIWFILLVNVALAVYWHRLYKMLDLALFFQS